MKKLTLIFIVLVAYSAVALAQPRAFGGRIGCSIGASGQYSIGKNMLQIDIDLLGFRYGVQTTVIYNWLFPVKSWKNGAEWTVFIGIGAGGGYCWYDYSDTLSDVWSRFWFIGVVSNLGFGLNFKSGLQLTAEWRPLFGPCIDKSSGITDYCADRLYITACAVGVRYKFK